ncbi:MAG: septal ring lytic transglycosylase RlpA family protein [Pseudomonadota bacterium]
MRFTYIVLILALLPLSACSEARYAAHLAKQVTLPTDTAESKGTFKVGNPYRIKGKRYFPQESYDHSETGIASWYGPNFHGKQTANGEIFDKYELTAAHRTLQMPSLVRVTNLENGKSLILRINDRGPFAHNRIIDVSQRASELLGFRKQGTAKVRVDVLGPESRQVAEAAKRGEDTRGYEVALNQNRVPARIRPTSKPQQPIQTAQAPVRPPQPKPVVEPVSFDTAPAIRPVQAVQGQPLPPSQQRIFVQAGAFSQENNAMALARKLEPYGPSKVYLARVDNRPYYRVRLGPYDTTQQADLALNTIISSGKSDAKIVID